MFTKKTIFFTRSLSSYKNCKSNKLSLKRKQRDTIQAKKKYQKGCRLQKLMQVLFVTEVSRGRVSCEKATFLDNSGTKIQF